MALENTSELFGDIADIMAPTVGATTNGRKGRRDANGNLLPDAFLWLDIGIPVEFRDPESGEMVRELITLPVNVPLDTMKRRAIPERKPTTAKGVLHMKRVLASNALLDKLLKLADAKIGKEGGRYSLNDLPLELELHRLAPKMTDEESLAEESSEIMDSINAAFGI